MMHDGARICTRVVDSHTRRRFDQSCGGKFHSPPQTEGSTARAVLKLPLLDSVGPPAVPVKVEKAASNRINKVCAVIRYG